MKLKHINTLLFFAIVLVNTYLILSPLIPAWVFWINQRTGSQFRQLNFVLHAPDTTVKLPPGNRLIIPKIGISERIEEGKDLSAASRGPWRLPHTSMPDKGSNTVIVGHRFTYADPHGDFYQLDKLKKGDEIGILWHGKKYMYSVATSRVVPPTMVSIEAPSKNSMLTLYTCTPLWWPKNRLAITAEAL